MVFIVSAVLCCPTAPWGMGLTAATCFPVGTWEIHATCVKQRKDKQFMQTVLQNCNTHTRMT